MSMQWFANAGCNGYLQHSDFVVFEEKLMMLWRRGEGVRRASTTYRMRVIPALISRSAIDVKTRLVSWR